VAYGGKGADNRLVRDQLNWLISRTSREPPDGWNVFSDAGVMDYGPMTANTRIDPLKLQAWIDMNSVTDLVPVPGEKFIYVDDLMMALCGGLVEPAEG
jgi:hypothetical protein